MVRSSLHYAESNLRRPLGTNPVQLLTACSDQSAQHRIVQGKAERLGGRTLWGKIFSWVNELGDGILDNQQMGWISLLGRAFKLYSFWLYSVFHQEEALWQATPSLVCHRVHLVHSSMPYLGRPVRSEVTCGESNISCKGGRKWMTLWNRKRKFSLKGHWDREAAVYACLVVPHYGLTVSL